MKKKKKNNRGMTMLIIAVVAILALFLGLINFITDLLWFIEMQYLSVFLMKLFTQLKLGIPTFLIVGLLSFIYLKALKRGYYKKVESPDNDPGISKKLNLAALGLAAVFAALTTFFIASRTWFEVLKFMNSTDFNISDPLYNLDMSFYLFKLDLIKQANTIAIGIIIGFAAITVIYYMFMMSLRKPMMYEDTPGEEDDYFDEDDEYGGNQGSGQNRGGNSGFGSIDDIIDKVTQLLGGKGKPKGGAQDFRGGQGAQNKFDDDNFKRILNIASKQIIVLGVLFFLMVGVNFFLKQFSLLYSTTGVLYGASFTDVNVTLWMYRILIGLSVLGAIGFVIGLKQKKFRSMLTIPVIMIAVGVLGTGGSYIVQNYIVSPDEINKERQYLARNIEATRFAYNLHNVSERDFPALNNLTPQDLANNLETINNIRINDYEPVRRFYNTVQTLRPYYRFTDVFVDRYMINGEYTQTYIAARELDISHAASPIPQTWLNKHIKYTHGYGITLSRVDQITPSGQPEMLIRNIPPASQVKEIQITLPEIYFGNVTQEYILIGTDEKEFNYPTEGLVNPETRYIGNAGIKLNFINKIMFAIRERNLRIFLASRASEPEYDLKIIINRNIAQRVRTIMPRLAYDPEPYMVTVDGRLFWIIDAYTLSTNYPYSEPYSRYSSGATNYIRNSVKVVIDAYNGDTNYYVVDPDDPIVQTYRNIFPALFKDFDEMDKMSPELKKHIRYPNQMLNIQANVFQRYHMTNEVMFYQNEDLWQIAREIYERSEQQMVPNYYIMKLPSEQKAEFVNTIPYTPRDRLNLTALLIARNDIPNYGQLVLLRLPKGNLTYGPMNIEAQIDQHPVISRDFTMWGSSGSVYNRGNLFIVPVEDSLLYVEVIYLEAETSSIPEVKRVIVAYGDEIAYQETLNEALEELFGKFRDTATSGGGGGTSGQQGGTTTIEPGTKTEAELIALAAEAFANAQLAQRTGDWAGYGRYIGQLERYLDELMRLTEPAEPTE